MNQTQAVEDNEEVVPPTDRPVALPGQLVEVMFETTLGARYVFPDMDAVEMEKLANFFPESHTSITIANVSRACLVIPVRIIKTFFINGFERWRRPE